MKEVIKLEDGRVKVRTINQEPTKTQQHYKDQCDINKIIDKAKKGGGISHINPHAGKYLDLTVLPADYQTAMEVVVKANEAFMDLPAKVRDEFGHDPARLIKFLEDPKNLDRAVDLGLVNRPVQPIVEEKPVDTKPKEA